MGGILNYYNTFSTRCSSELLAMIQLSPTKKAICKRLNELKYLKIRTGKHTRLLLLASPSMILKHWACLHWKAWTLTRLGSHLLEQKVSIFFD